MSYRTVLEHSDELFTYPDEQLEAIRSWNHDRERLYESLGEDLYVPRIFLLKYQDEVQSAIVWPDAIWTLVPEVDQVIIVRDKLAPRKLFVKRTDSAIVSWGEIEPLLKQFKSRMHSGAYYLNYPEIPKPVRKMIAGLKPQHEQPEKLYLHQVLGRELIEEVRQSLD